MSFARITLARQAGQTSQQRAEAWVADLRAVVQQYLGDGAWFEPMMITRRTTRDSDEFATVYWIHATKQRSLSATFEPGLMRVFVLEGNTGFKASQVIMVTNTELLVWRWLLGKTEYIDRR